MSWHPKVERYCIACEEFFELTSEQYDHCNIRHHGCGYESIPAEDSGIKPDSQIYKEENPR